MTPTLHLSCAVSADGYLDDTSRTRAILSSPEDLDAVLALRAQMDMIVIGAETLRRDNPSLATRGETHIAARKAAGLAPHPIKVVVTRSGHIPADRAFFETGDGETITLSQTATKTPGTVMPFSGNPVEVIQILAQDRGVQNILVEGGAQMLHLTLPYARFLRLAVSPRTLGNQGHAFFRDPDTIRQDFIITHEETLGDTRVYHIDLLLTRARPLMVEALDLSAKCPPSETAFAVGCLGCGPDLTTHATGYSRETGPKDHAEEAMLSKLSDPPHTVICTLEPCLSRASKSKGCAKRLVEAGVSRVIYAVAEDQTFTRQSGLQFLREQGVDVLHLPGFEAGFRTVNKTIYGEP